MIFISRIKRAAWLVAISAFAATVMPTASLAEGELDPASGDFTVNVYADLDEFGTLDPCEGFGGASSLAIQDEYERDWSLEEDGTGVVSLERTGTTEFSETTEPGLGDLFAFYNLSMFTDIPLVANPFTYVGEGPEIASVTYDTSGGENLLVFDAPPFGVIDSSELMPAAEVLSQPRLTIYAPDYDVAFDADDCDFSSIYGVLTSARSEVLYQATEADFPYSIELDFTGDPETMDWDGGTAHLRVGTNIIGESTPVPKFEAFSPVDSGDLFGGHWPTLIGQSGTQPISALMHIFGDYPAGTYSVNIFHKLFVDPVQIDYLICLYGIEICEG